MDKPVTTVYVVEVGSYPSDIFLMGIFSSLELAKKAVEDSDRRHNPVMWKEESYGSSTSQGTSFVTITPYEVDPSCD